MKVFLFHIPDSIEEGAYFFTIGVYMFVPLIIYKNESSIGTEPVSYLAVFNESWWVLLGIGSDSYP